jgi:hypothetical protein
MNKFKCSAIALFLMLSLQTMAQSDYKTAVGVRVGGYENGLSVKHFTNSSTAIEGILGLRRGVLILTGLYEKHAVAFSEPSLNWYYGAGGHIGSINGDRYYGNDKFYRDNTILLGADGILGLEWKIPEIPFAISADLHPRLEFANGPYLGLETAATIKFTFQ